jgi:hypothetical protein
VEDIDLESENQKLKEEVEALKAEIASLTLGSSSCRKRRSLLGAVYHGGK